MVAAAAALAPLEQTLFGMAVVVGVCARLAGAGMSLEVTALAGTAALSGTLTAACPGFYIATDRRR